MDKNDRQAAVRRQKKNAKNNAKRKAKPERLKTLELGQSFESRTGYSKQLVRSCPTGPAWRTENLFDAGIGQVIATRILPDNLIMVASILLDAWCLGAKNAFIYILTPIDLETCIADYNDALKLLEIEPSGAVKLVTQAVEYAAGLGLKPHLDYADAKIVMQGIDTIGCNETFVFGKNGKPFYFQGRYDSFGRACSILTQLEDTCGEGNFDFVLTPQLVDDVGEEDYNDDDTPPDGDDA